jgi:hypothetical protein
MSKSDALFTVPLGDGDIDAIQKRPPLYLLRLNAFALLLYSTSVFLIHLFVSAACFDLRRTSSVMSVQRAANVVGVLAIVSASVRALQLILYAIGDRLWLNNARMGNAAVSVLLAAVLIGATGPKTSVMYENRAGDSVPTSAGVFYGVVVAAVSSLAEVITSHTVNVRLETRRSSLVAESRVAHLRLLMVGVASVFTAATIAMNAYALLACVRLAGQTVVPYAMYTELATDTVASATTLRDYLIAALVFNSVSAATGALRTCSVTMDSNIAARMARLVVSFLGVVFVCISFGAVLPEVSFVGVSHAHARGESYVPATDYASVTQASVVSTLALSLGSMVMFHAVAASRLAPQ